MEILANKLGITDAHQLAIAEERLSKQAARELFDSGFRDKLPAGTFIALKQLHEQLFIKLYPFAGQLRTVDIAKGNLHFAPVMYLQASLDYIDTMPQGTFDQIIEKYVEMNVAHPFREGNGRRPQILQHSFPLFRRL